MEVILREHVDNLGRRGDVVKVAEGVGHVFRQNCVGKVTDLAQAVANGVFDFANRVSRILHDKTSNSQAF